MHSMSILLFNDCEKVTVSLFGSVGAPLGGLLLLGGLNKIANWKVTRYIKNTLIIS